jgi:hypothetical protein
MNKLNTIFILLTGIFYFVGGCYFIHTERNLQSVPVASLLITVGLYFFIDFLDKIFDNE